MTHATGVADPHLTADQQGVARARYCPGEKAKVYEASGPTVLDALAALVDLLAREGDGDNPTINGVYVWDNPEWEPGDDRVIIATVSG